VHGDCTQIALYQRFHNHQIESCGFSVCVVTEFSQQATILPKASNPCSHFLYHRLDLQELDEYCEFLDGVATVGKRLLKTFLDVCPTGR
jgi:hypothetical protein